MTFGDVNETVTAKDVINLRSTPYTGDEGNVVGQLKNGETLVRTGRNDSTGWSRLEYNGQTVYAVTAYLTTDLAYKTPDRRTRIVSALRTAELSYLWIVMTTLPPRI